MPHARNVFWPITCRTLSYFRVKIEPFVTKKSDQDPDPDPHWFGSLDSDLIEIKSWIRIRIDPNADPQPWYTVELGRDLNLLERISAGTSQDQLADHTLALTKK